MEKLTTQEEEAMMAVWKHGKGFIRDFLELFPHPAPPYTTLASTFKNLERKGFLKGEKIANSYFYSPLILAQDYKKRFLNGFVNNYFQNSFKELVTFFASEQKINSAELQEIIKLIDNSKL